MKVRLIKRFPMSIVPKLRTKHNGYRPGKLLDLYTDQCRFSIADGIFCGVKVSHTGSAWCSQHKAIVYMVPRKFLEAAE